MPLLLRFQSSFASLIGCLALASTPLHAQDFSEAALEKVDALFSRWDSYDAPGMAVGIVQAGELAWAKGYGMANLETGMENGPEVIYRIGSTSKQFTTACIALLVLDGKLDLASDVRAFFPSFPKRDPAVTVRHMIHHSSGLPDYINVQFAAAGSAKAWFTTEDSIEVIAAAELDFEPGARFEYSNSNYLLLGEIVRRVSQKSLRDFAHERIFEPLGMENTHFHDRHDEVVVGRSHGYSQQEEAGRGEWRVDITTLNHVGDGGVFTTIEDLARWDANFYENRIGHGQAFLDLMHTRGTLANGERLDYAFGLMHGEQRGSPTVHHGGSWVGYRAELLRLPEADFSVIVLANVSNVNPRGLAQRMVDVLLDDLEQD